MNNLRVRHQALTSLAKQVCKAMLTRSKRSSQTKLNALRDILKGNRIIYVHDSRAYGDSSYLTNKFLSERYGIQVKVGLSNGFTKDEADWCFNYNQMAETFYTFLHGRNVYAECKNDAAKHKEQDRDRHARETRSKAEDLVRKESTAEEIIAAYPGSIAVTYSPEYALHMLKTCGPASEKEWQKISQHANTIRFKVGGTKVYFYFNRKMVAVDYKIVS